MKIKAETKWEAYIPNEKKSEYNAYIQLIDQDILKHLEQNRYYNNVGIQAGTAGEILYLFYSAIHQNDESLYNAATKQLEELIYNINPKTHRSFCSGVSGLVWLLIHLEETEILFNTCRVIGADVIDNIFLYSIDEIKNSRYDYMHNGLGSALAFVAGYRIGLNYKDQLEAIVNELYKSALRKGDTIFWQYLLPEKPETKMVSQGLSHGLPSIVAILSKIYEAGIAQEKCKEMIQGMINFMLSSRNPPDVYSLYPASVKLHSPHSSASGSRIGWCYGDLNIATALYYANKVSTIDNYEHITKEILYHSISRNGQSNAAIIDGSFCHGTSGTAHYYNRLSKAFCLPEAKESAALLMGQTFEKIRYTEESGFQVLNREEWEVKWTNHKNIISGAAGIGLTFLAAISNSSPDWDEIFLINL